MDIPKSFSWSLYYFEIYPTPPQKTLSSLFYYKWATVFISYILRLFLSRAYKCWFQYSINCFLILPIRCIETEFSCKTFNLEARVWGSNIFIVLSYEVCIYNKVAQPLNISHKMWMALETSGLLSSDLGCSIFYNRYMEEWVMCIVFIWLEPHHHYQSLTLVYALTSRNCSLI